MSFDNLGTYPEWIIECFADYICIQQSCTYMYAYVHVHVHSYAPNITSYAEPDRKPNSKQSTRAETIFHME